MICVSDVSVKCTMFMNINTLLYLTGIRSISDCSETAYRVLDIGAKLGRIPGISQIFSINFVFIQVFDLSAFRQEPRLANRTIDVFIEIVLSNVSQFFVLISNRPLISVGILFILTKINGMISIKRRSK